MADLNDLDRFHLVAHVGVRVSGLGGRAHIKRPAQDKLIENEQ